MIGRFEYAPLCNQPHCSNFVPSIRVEVPGVGAKFGSSTGAIARSNTCWRMLDADNLLDAVFRTWRAFNSPLSNSLATVRRFSRHQINTLREQKDCTLAEWEVP